MTFTCECLCILPTTISPAGRVISLPYEPSAKWCRTGHEAGPTSSFSRTIVACSAAMALRLASCTARRCLTSSSMLSPLDLRMVLRHVLQRSDVEFPGALREHLHCGTAHVRSARHDTHCRIAVQSATQRKLGAGERECWDDEVLPAHVLVAHVHGELGRTSRADHVPV